MSIQAKVAATNVSFEHRFSRVVGCCRRMLVKMKLQITWYCVCWCSYDQEIDGVDRISPPVQCEVSRHVGPGFGWFWTKYWLVMVVLKHIAADCFGADHEAETFRR